MIKVKTLLKFFFYLIVTFFVVNASYARLIAPEPKPTDYKLKTSQNKQSEKKQKSINDKIIPKTIELQKE